jgi:hypothetical protein
VPPTTRRALLGSVCTLVGVTGCLGSPGESESTPTGTGTVTRTRTPTETATDDACSASNPPAPTDAAAAPKSYPRKPSDLTRDSVGSFVEAYERAYQYNSTLAEYPDKIGRLNDLDISINEVTVTVEDGVFVADISGQANTGITVDGGAESQTQTPLPMGHRPFEAAYTVSDRFVRREGVVYECW